MWTQCLLVAAALLQGIVIVVWLWQQVEMSRVQRLGLRISNHPTSGPLPPLTVVVPARNEAERIGGCVSSVLQQDYPGLRLIVVDDRSIDSTGQAARLAAAGDERFRLVKVEELPAGWGGKSHALWHGAKLTDTPWVLFLDADCRIDPGGLAATMAYALESKCDLLSLWLRDASEGFWERLLLPLCGAMIVIWYGRGALRQSPGGRAFANGQFLLIRRDAYVAMQGHAAVRNALIEDIPLARNAVRHGLVVRSALGSEVCAVRMYASLKELVAGWQRIYIGVLSPAQIALCAGSILVGSLAPYVVLPMLIARAERFGDSWSTAFVVLSVVHLAALMATSVRFFALARCRLRYLWLYPLSCVGVLGILASAWIRSLRGTTVRWRGMNYRVERGTIRP